MFCKSAKLKMTMKATSTVFFRQVIISVSSLPKNYLHLLSDHQRFTLTRSLTVSAIVLSRLIDFFTPRMSTSFLIVVPYKRAIKSYIMIVSCFFFNHLVCFEGLSIFRF